MFKRGSIYWTKIRYDGKIVQKSLETSDKKLAQQIEAKIRTRIVEGTFFEKSKYENKTVKIMLDKFIKEHAPTVKPNTQKSYKTSLIHLLPFFGDTVLSKVSREMIRQYKTERFEAGAKPSSVNREMSMLSKAFNLAVSEWEWMENCPKISKEKENNEIDRYLAYEEDVVLLRNSSEGMKDLIVFALNTGLRQDEQLSLVWSRVDLQRKTILIQDTKSGKPRTVPLNQAALNVLLKRGEIRSIKNDLVFLSSSGTKINNCNLSRGFNRLIKRSNIEKITWHGLRRTFATRLVQKGIDIYKVAELLGHSDVRTTQQRYAHHCSESLRSGVDILDVGYNLATIDQKQVISGM